MAYVSQVAMTSIRGVKISFKRTYDSLREDT